MCWFLLLSWGRTRMELALGTAGKQEEEFLDKLVLPFHSFLHGAASFFSAGGISWFVKCKVIDSTQNQWICILLFFSPLQFFAPLFVCVCV